MIYNTDSDFSILKCKCIKIITLLKLLLYYSIQACMWQDSHYFFNCVTAKKAFAQFHPVPPSI